MTIFEKNIDNKIFNDNIVELKSGKIIKNIYKKGLYDYSKKSVLIGLYSYNPNFNQDITYIQSIQSNNRFRAYEVLQEFLKNRNELIFADPITIIKKSEIAAISNNKTMMNKYIDQSKHLLINIGFIKTIFKKKNGYSIHDVYVYSNDKGKFFNKLYKNRR